MVGWPFPQPPPQGYFDTRRRRFRRRGMATRLCTGCRSATSCSSPSCRCRCWECGTPATAGTGEAGVALRLARLPWRQRPRRTPTPGRFCGSVLSGGHARGHAREGQSSWCEPSRVALPPHHQSRPARRVGREGLRLAPAEHHALLLPHGPHLGIRCVLLWAVTPVRTLPRNDTVQQPPRCPARPAPQSGWRASCPASSS